MDKLKIPENEPIEHGMISRAIENAQKKVEGHNFDIRKHLIEYDDVMNRQREVIYDNAVRCWRERIFVAPIMPSLKRWWKILSPRSAGKSVTF